MVVTPTLTLRLQQEIRDRLEALAENDRRKLTQYVQKVLAEHVSASSRGKNESAGSKPDKISR